MVAILAVFGKPSIASAVPGKAGEAREHGLHAETVKPDRLWQFSGTLITRLQSSGMK